MSAMICVLPAVQAMAVVAEQREQRAVVRGPEMAFYRKYTEGMLRKYVRLSMEAGRVSSLLGQQEMFRGRMTSYRVRSFEDGVIFVLDVERCFGRLEQMEQTLITRIALQEYTQGETAALLRMGLRTVGRRYAAAMDRLTELFLEYRLLEPMLACQGDRL